MRLHAMQFPRLGDEYDANRMRFFMEELERLYASLVSQPDPREVFQETATNLADAAAAINTTDKYLGKVVIDTTNSRMLYALGTGPTSGWRVVDGSSTVTPS